MKKLLVPLTLISFHLFGQKNNTDNYQEQNVYVKMDLQPVYGILTLSQNQVEVYNIETVYLNYYDRYIKLEPGIHRLTIEVNETAHLNLIPYGGTDLETQSTYKRVIKNGREDFDYFTGKKITMDYIEYNICDYFLEKKVVN